MFSESVKEIALSIGDNTITGKDCIVTSFEVNYPNSLPIHEIGSRYATGYYNIPGRITIKIEMECLSLDFLNELSGVETKKISLKKVKDCNVRELLFAIRQKTKQGEIK